MPIQETVILVDEYDTVVGTAEKLHAHQQGLLHRAFSVFVLRETGHHPEILLQQRQHHKYHSAGLWSNTCCSHPRPDESTVAAALRRLKEEMGIDTPLTDIGHFIYEAHFDNGLIEHEFDHVFLGIDDGTLFEINAEEVAAYRWVPLDMLEKEVREQPEQFTPWFSQALSLLQKRIRDDVNFSG